MSNVKTPAVSVALCTYNGERFLQEQLDSIAMQTRMPDEVVVGDDGSSDSTLSILERWKQSVPFSVRIERNERNLGFAKNFESTLSRCTGDVVFLCDQDDVWLPNRVERMTEALEQDAAVGIVICGVDLIDQEGKAMSDEASRVYRMSYPDDTSVYYLEYALKHPSRAGCMMAVRRSVLEKVYPLPDGWSHDVWLFSMAPLYCEIQTIPDVLMHFRRHGNNASVLGKEKDWANGRDVYYLTSVGQYRAHTPLREDMIKRLSQLPPSAYRDGYLKYLKGQDKHFGNRCKIEDRFWTNLHTFVMEVLSGRYFQHKQPLKCMLFDVKEGILNSFKRAPSKEK